MIIIRPAKETDAAVLAAIGLRAWADATTAIGVTEALRDHARYAFTNFAQSSWNAITLAERDGVIAGWAARENFDETISDFWVDPGFQRKGVGRALLAEIERLITNRGYAVARLESHAHNVRAVSFFRSHDYNVSWLSMKYSRNLDREVQSIGLQKQLVEVETETYGFDF